MTPWETWCVGVIRGVGEPFTAVSVDTHWAWSNAETAPYDLMRWNNPQNSTEKWYDASGNRVSRDSGAQPGAHDVQIYPSVDVGIAATVYNLVNEPYYPAIVANLRAGLPRQQWGATSQAGTELHVWGTGTTWLTAAPYFGPAPIIPGEDMDQNDPLVRLLFRRLGGVTFPADGSIQDQGRASLTAAGQSVWNGVPYDETATPIPGGTPWPAMFAPTTGLLAQILAGIKGLLTSGGLTPAQAQQLTDILAGVQQIESQLKAGLKAS